MYTMKARFFLVAVIFALLFVDNVRQRIYE